ncbi:hypothetical protein AltI4_44980 (plasmid) [Alteromonas sp. I4]|nr:hypothetical protein AltI4_44980 [Alteromonas sp. I4]
MIDFEKRLQSLKDRRQGSRERVLFENMDNHSANIAALSGLDIRTKEAFETLQESAGVKYAIGAMAAVDAKSTQVSINEGNRVADSLVKSLNSQGECVESRLQGSVALDIHIKGHSDVDMLIVVENPINYESPEVHPGRYSPATDTRPLLSIARDVRNKSEIILPANFPKADIDTSNNKSIEVKGGSLQRKVDIVPAIWFHSRQYQQSRIEHDKGIKIYHKQDREFILNYPFLHIHNVNQKDAIYSGNLKCVIRLMKNMIADMPEYKKVKAKKLSSFDLAGIGYQMNGDLATPYYLRLGLVEKTRSHLSLILASKEYRDLLHVPDGTRKIFDDETKVEALEILTKECEDLSLAIFKELKPLGSTYDSSVLVNKSIYG